MTRRVTAVLVEAQARWNLRDFLGGLGWIEVVGEARDPKVFRRVHRSRIANLDCSLAR